GLDRRPHEKRHVPRLLWRDDGGVEAHLRGDLRTAGLAELEEVDDAHEVHEAWRLMYVAATRARDHLLACLPHRDGTSAERSVAARLPGLVQGRPDLWRRLELDRPHAPAGADDPDRDAPTDALPCEPEREPHAPAGAAAAEPHASTGA